MKRSSCLSALSVGLSLAAAHPAWAAPEGGVPKPVRVAQAAPLANVAQTADPQDSSPNATAAPQTADPAAQPAQPAVTVGAKPATTDTPQAAAEEPKAAPKPRPWAGTQVYVTQSVTTATVFRGQQQDYNPTTETALWLMPRYTLSKDFQLRARQIVNYEQTNSDSTLYRNEPVLSDTSFQLFYRSIPEVAGFKPMVAANLALPLSKASRYRTMLFAPGATLQLARSWDRFAGGELQVIATGIYTHPIYRSENPEVADPLPYRVNCTGGNCDGVLLGQNNPSDTFGYALLVSATWGKWSPAIYYLGASQLVYQPNEEVRNPVDNAPINGRPRGVEAHNVRQIGYFSVWLDYEANSWLTAEVGYWLSRGSVLNGNGRFGNPFFDSDQDMRVYLGANVNIDNVMKELSGEGGEAGVVRAKNTKSPMFRF